MRPTWGPPGSCRPQVGPMLTPWTLLSGMVCTRTTFCRETEVRLIMNRVKLHAVVRYISELLCVQVCCLIPLLRLQLLNNYKSCKLDRFESVVITYIQFVTNLERGQWQTLFYMAVLNVLAWIDIPHFTSKIYSPPAICRWMIFAWTTNYISILRATRRRSLQGISWE